MAKVSPNSPLAGASGKIGTAVTYMLNGKQVIRSLPSRPRKFKATPLQQEHFNSFAAQHAFAKEIKRLIIDPIWSLASMPVGLNPYNYFIKSNRNAFGKSNIVEFPELMILSIGSLLPVKELHYHVEQNILQLKWNNTIENGFAKADDKLHLVLLIDRKSIVFVDNTATRADGIFEYDVVKYPGSSVEGFIYWSTVNYLSYSPSVYFKAERV